MYYDLEKVLNDMFTCVSNLRRPIYRATAAYGHFGRDEVEFSWENLDIVDIFKKLL